MVHWLRRRVGRRHRSVGVAFLFFLGFAILFPSGTGAKIVERIVAVVNDDVITLSEVRDIAVPYLEKMKKDFSVEYGAEEMEETERRIVDQLIDEMLIAQEAERVKVEVSDKEIDFGIMRVREEANLNETQFKQALEDDGLTLDEYRKQFRKQMKKMKLIDQEIKAKVQVTGKEIAEYYQVHESEFNAPPGVRLQQILLVIPPEATREEIELIRARSEKILQQIQGGEDFSAMASRYSQDATAAGGDMGVFTRGELFPALDEIVFTLPVGEVSPVIRSPKGFHIVKVLERKERQKMTEEERREEIEDKLYEQKVEDAFKRWLKKLRKRSFITINL